MSTSLNIGTPIVAIEGGHDAGWNRTIETFPVIGRGHILQTTTILKNADGSHLLATSSVFIPDAVPEIDQPSLKSAAAKKEKRGGQAAMPLPIGNPLPPDGGQTAPGGSPGNPNTNTPPMSTTETAAPDAPAEAETAEQEAPQTASTEETQTSGETAQE